jgi:hypothetical protein
MIGVELVQVPAATLGLRIGKRSLHNGLLLRYGPHRIAFGPQLLVAPADNHQMAGILELSTREVLREVWRKSTTPD